MKIRKNLLADRLAGQAGKKLEAKEKKKREKTVIVKEWPREELLNFEIDWARQETSLCIVFST